VIQTALLCLFFIAPFFVYSQSTVVLQGKIYDKFTGNPASVDYMVSSSGGEKGKGKSDVNGDYQQTVKAGETYTFRFRSYNVLNQVEEVFVENQGKYYEKDHNFKVGVLTQGSVISAVNGFESKSASPTSVLSSLIAEAKSLIKDNRSIQIEIVAAFDQSKIVKKTVSAKKTEVKSKKTKGKKVEPEPTPVSTETEEEVQSSVSESILQARKVYLESSFTAMEKKQITFKTKNEGVRGGNAVIFVGEVKDPFQR